MIRYGFSLIEMMVVVALLAIIMTLTIANVSWLNSMVLRSEVDKLHTICMYVQRSAQVSDEPQQLTFDVAGNYYAFNGYQERLPHSLRFGIKPGIKGPPSKPTASPNSPVTFKNQSIRFTPRGIMHPGTVYLTDTGYATTYAVSSPIADYSYVRKYRYHADRWIPVL